MIALKVIRASSPRLLAVAVAVFILLSTPAAAQFTAGTILGTVSDPTRAVIPDATVTATHVDTGVSRAVKTDQTGNYILVNMPLGRYQVKAEAAGFKAGVSGPFELVVDQKLRSDFVLEVGSTSETVEVKGVGATMLQTEQADINQIVQGKEIRELPLNGRDFFSLLTISNGIQDTSNDQGGATTNVTFSINGMRPESNSVTLDGVEMSSIRESDVDMRPNLDAIQEFKLLSSVFSAEYGHTSGGVISIQSKSGTNSMHGSWFHYLRNDALNASNFFRNPVDPNKAPLKQNQFGGTLGGPIRHDKTFFFVDYQGYRLRKINEAFAKVPEAPFRSGDFSSLLPDTGIWDPRTGGLEQFKDPSRGTPSNPEGLNIIPLNRLNPFAKAILDATALPNLPNNYPLGNYFVRQRDQMGQNEAGVRLDHSFSQATNLFVRYRWNDGFTNTADPLARPDGPMPGIGLEVGDDARAIVQGGTHRDRNNNVVASLVHVFNPWLVNEARVGMHRYHLDVYQHAYGMNLAEKFGLKGVNDGPNYSGLPIFYLDNYTSIGGDDWKPLFFKETSFQFNDNLTLSLGRHSLRVGGEFRPRYEDNYYVIFPAGAFWVGNGATSYSGWWWQGHEIADLLLGLPFEGYRGRRFSSPELRDKQYSFFVQDDIHVTDRLTLNLGLRYEYASPFYSPSHALALFDQSQMKMDLAGVNGVSNYIIEPDKNNWAPRVGLAYKLRPKTTIRAGFGMFYDPATDKRDDVKFNPPFYRQYTVDQTWTLWDAAPPPFTDPGTSAAGYDIFDVDRHLRTAYSEQYSFAIQHELPGGFLFEAAYVGSQGHKLPYVVNYNQSRQGGLPKPVPGVGKINQVTNVGNMVYNSGQFKLERRFAPGFYVLGTYTWSKSIDNVSSAMFAAGVTGGVQNIFDPSRNRGVSDWDVPHKVAVSYIYDLPFGKGKPFLSDAPAAVTKLLGNWQMTGILVTSSGVPGTVSVGSSIPGGDARPDVLRNPNLPSDQRSPDHWFDTTAFVPRRDANNNLLPGNAGRNILRGPGYTNFDLGLLKSVPLGERLKLQFRGEGFNLSNTPHFALPVRRMNDPSFGRITHTRNSTNFGSTATSYSARMFQLSMKLEF